MGLLDRAGILAAQDLKHEDVEVPEWKGTVRIRMMTSREKQLISAKLFKEEITHDADGKAQVKRVANPDVNLRATLVGFCLIDENGGRLFGDEEIALLESKAAPVLERLFIETQRINGMTEEAVAEAKND